MDTFTVPALHKNPDIEVLDNLNGTEFALIEHGRLYNGKWKTEELNNNDFNETGEVQYFIENWLFQLHPGTNVSRWVNRETLRSVSLRTAFILTKNDLDLDQGTFSFMQKSKAAKQGRFSVSIIVLRKMTQNLNLTYTSSFLSFMPQGAIKDLCNQWSDKTPEKIDYTKLKRCPCTLQSAKMEPDLSQDFTCSSSQPGCHENVKAHRCYIMKLNST